MEKILIFGTGSVSEYIFGKLDPDRVEIIAFINSSSTMDSFHGYPVISVSDIHNKDYDYILIASGYVQQITSLLLKENVSQDKIVSFIYDNAETYKTIGSEIENCLDSSFRRNRLNSWLKRNSKVSRIYPAVFWDDFHAVKDVYKDFVREQTVKLISDCVLERKIPGEVAELGVYKGDFTIALEKLFPGKKLYLYDTFEGFSSEDVKKDKSLKNKSGESDKFKDTSVQLVLSRLSSPETAVVKKGFFPDTFEEKGIPFAFVSIDLNLYDPVKAALDLFYPALSPGGYILVSDYYAPFYKGTKEAVDKWCEENNKSIVPVADFYGSAIIQK